MHGHQLRLLAEEEHVSLWTDITVGGLYGAIKRLAAEDLIEEVRVERAGAYPQRQVWAITDAGREALGALRLRALREIVIKPDPFDLAITRLCSDHLDDLPTIIAARIGSLNAMLTEWEAHAATIDRYLTAAEASWHCIAQGLPAACRNRLASGAFRSAARNRLGTARWG